MSSLARNGRPGPAARPHGLSAFVRCKNEEEFILPTLLSLERFVDEIVVVLNSSTDGTGSIVEELTRLRPKFRMLEYGSACEQIGLGYLERVRASPAGSLAKYYNWCLENTTYSHVCKWDGDMLALPPFEIARAAIDQHDAVAFDGYDLIGAKTTDLETRIFRFDPTRAHYTDWDLYEVLSHDYGPIVSIKEKCYLHLKLGKREWLYRPWTSPNDSASSRVPHAGRARTQPGSFPSRFMQKAKALFSRL